MIDHTMFPARRLRMFAVAALTLGAALLFAPPARAMGSDDDKKCGAGEVYNETCKACAKICGDGLAWDCDARKCVRKESRALSDDERYAEAVGRIKEGRYAEALKLLHGISRRDDPKVLNYIGYSTRKLGNVDEGIAYYHKALALDPNYTVAREYLGEGYLQKGDLASAEEQLARIETICGGKTCHEYEELAEKIAAFKAGKPAAKDGW